MAPADIQRMAPAVGRTTSNGNDDVGHDYLALSIPPAPAGETPRTVPFPPAVRFELHRPAATGPPLRGWTFTTVANLANLLPTGTVLAFQTLNPTFSNRGTCIAVHRYLTAALITCCALSCAFFSFTDTLLGPGGEAYAGVATFRGFYLFNGQPYGVEEERQLPAADLLRELRIRWVDYVHAFFSILVFLALALSDAHVQSCLFENAGQEYLRDLPLAAGFLASFVFMVFPSCRRGVGYSVDMEPRPLRAASRDAGRPASAGVNAIATPSPSAPESGSSTPDDDRSSTTSEDDHTHVAGLISHRR